MTQPIHTIAEEEPVFKAGVKTWLWMSRDDYGQAPVGWNLPEKPFSSFNGPRCWYTHWCHSDTMPTVDPTTPPPAGEKAPASQLTTDEKAGIHSMPDQLLNVNAICDERDRLQVERDALSRELKDLKYCDEKYGPFRTWAQEYLSAGRWAGFHYGDAVKTELLERDSQLQAAQSRIAELEAQLSDKKDLGNDVRQDGDPRAFL